MVAGGGECPTEDAIQRLLAGRLGGDVRERVTAHLAHCHSCFEDVGVAAHMARTARADGVAVEPHGDAPAARERVGRYELHGKLGLGGMGTVFRARAVDSGEWVALKRVRTDRPALIEALRREIHALWRIDHPGVVRVIAQDTTRGVPWYAMEILEGETLADHILATQNGLGPRPRFSDFLPLLAVMRRLCETLAFLHGEGVVHRDLTPGNVIIRADGSPVLVDFGLATKLPAPGREALDLHLPRAGTPNFSAPEQRLRNVVDARADLYALGCILFYTFTGFPPSGDNPTTIRALHENAVKPPPPPRRPSQVVLDIPPVLDDVIMRMLAPDPRARLGYATDVARALDDTGVAPPPAAWCKPARCYMYRPAMFGREQPLTRLTALLQRGRQGQGGLALVAGESGVGKTRLALELAAVGRQSGFNVVAGACANVSGGGGGRGASGNAPAGSSDALHLFRPLIQAIIDHCRYRGPDETEAILGREADDLALAFPEIEEFIPRAAAAARALDIPADESRFRIISALSGVLERFARRTPLLLVLDDLQWADFGSLTMLESFVASLLDRSPIVVVGTYRTEELTFKRRQMLRAVAAEQLDLRRLEPRDIETMIGDMLALPHPSPDLVQSLMRASEGNPFFIAEYLRVAVEEGWLSRDRTGKWQMASKGKVALARAEPLPMPSSFFEVLDRRLAGLGPGAQRMCGLAAVAGRGFDVELIRAVMRESQDAFFDAVNELLVRHVLETDGPERMRFVHDKLREAAYARVDRAALPQHHRTVAVALESRAAGARGRFDAELAHHWRIGEDTRREAPYRLAAGEKAGRVGAYHEAILHLERALVLLPSGTPAAERARLERQLAEAHFGVGDMPASRRRLASACEQVGVPSPATRPGQLALVAGDVVGSLAIRALRPLCRPLLRQRHDEMCEAARAHERLAHVFFFENETVGVASSSLRALRAASHLGPSPELARILANLSLSAGLLSLHRLARALRGHAHRIATDIGDEAAVAWTAELDGVYRAGMGEFSAARSNLESALDTWQRLGHRRRWEECLTLLGMATYHAGDHQRAAVLRRELYVAGTTSRSPQTIGWALIGQAEDSLAAGAPQTAREQLAAALELGPAIRRVEEIWARGLLARAHLRACDQPAARMEGERALVLAMGTIPTAFYTLEGYLGMVEALLGQPFDSPAPSGRPGPFAAPSGSSAGHAAGFPSAAAARAAGQAVRAMQRFARVFPIAAAQAAVCRETLALVRRAGGRGWGRRRFPALAMLPHSDAAPPVDSAHER